MSSSWVQLRQSAAAAALTPLSSFASWWSYTLQWITVPRRGSHHKKTIFFLLLQLLLLLFFFLGGCVSFRQPNSSELLPARALNSLIPTSLEHKPTTHKTLICTAVVADHINRLQAIKQSSNHHFLPWPAERKKLVGKNHKTNLAIKNKKFPIQEEEEESQKGKKNSRLKKEEERLHLQHLSAKNRSCQGKRHCEKRTRLPLVFG